MSSQVTLYRCLSCVSPNALLCVSVNLTGEQRTGSHPGYWWPLSPCPCHRVHPQDCSCEGRTEAKQPLRPGRGRAVCHVTPTPWLTHPSECTYALMCTQVKFDTSKRLARALDSGYLDVSFFLRIVRL